MFRHVADAFEVNEAFAPVAPVNVTHVLGPTIANLYPGGLIPQGVSAELMLDQTRSRFGLQTTCEAGGTANATIYERLG